METFTSLRSQITERYPNLTLEQMQVHFKEESSFEASKNMWKKKFVQWGLKKNIRGREYKAMIRKKNERGPHKKTVFKFEGGREVREDKVARYEKKFDMQGNSLQPDEATPPGLQVVSPEAFQGAIDSCGRQPSPIQAAAELILRSSPFPNVLSPEISQMVNWRPQSPQVATPALSVFHWWDPFMVFCELLSLLSPTRLSVELWKTLLGLASSLDRYEEWKKIEALTPQIWRNTHEKPTGCEGCDLIRILEVCLEGIKWKKWPQGNTEGAVPAQLLENVALASIVKRTQKLAADGYVVDGTGAILTATLILCNIYVLRGKLPEAKTLLLARFCDIIAPMEDGAETTYKRMSAMITLLEYHMRRGERNGADELLRTWVGIQNVAIFNRVLHTLEERRKAYCRSHKIQHYRILRIYIRAQVESDRAESLWWIRSNDIKFLVEAAHVFKRALVCVDYLDNNTCGWNGVFHE